MDEYKEISAKFSDDNTYGIVIVSKDNVECKLSRPEEGYIVPLGQIYQTHTFEFIASEIKQYIVAFNNEVIVHTGAQILISLDLQYSNVYTLLCLSNKAVIEVVSFDLSMNKTSVFHTYIDGEYKEVSPSILLAMGLIKPTTPPIDPVIFNLDITKNV